MPDETPVIQTSPVVSPTGTPLIDPKWVPVILAVGGVVVTAIEAAGATVASPLAKTLLHLAALLVVGILGTISPGWRKP